MQRALLGGILVAVLTSRVGIFVVLRRSSFFGDSVAHASLTGVALGLLFGWDPFLTALGVAVLIALALPYLRKKSNLPLDSLLGFILPFTMAIGIIILARLPGYQPELISFLFGSILAISWSELVNLGILAIVVLTAVAFLGKQLVFVSFDEEYARISGFPVDVVNTLYSVLLAITIVASIRLVGIVLVNALLVIPVSTVRSFARSFRQMVLLTPVVAVINTVAGLVLSFFLNVPSGPAIAVVSGIVFLFGVLVRRPFA